MDLILEATNNKYDISFDVTTPRKAFAGHTVYRLLLKIHNEEYGPRYEFIAWKRFSEFKKLHKAIKNELEADSLNSFPEFAKGKLFGRFDDNVIEERRKASIQLMNFILTLPGLTNHKSFCAFLEVGRKNKSLAFAVTECNSLSSTEDPYDTDQYSLDRSTSPSASQEVLPTGSLNDAVDDITPDNVFLVQGDDDVRECWLREARSICGDDLEVLASEAPGDFPVTPRSSVADDDSVLFAEPLPCNENGYEEDVICTTGGRETPPANMEDRYKVDDRMSQIINQTVEEDDYVFQASVAMSNAIEQEELNNNEAAFEMYKFGLGLLLRGVQSDVNTERQEAVRRKTAQYLLRAEQLYNTKLHACTQQDVQLGDSKWRFRLSDVRVFGIINRVMLVEKINTTLNQHTEVYVMKVLRKQGGEYKRVKQKKPRNLYNCKFMARLYNCVETYTGVYLLLQHVTGGRLWDYLNLPIFEVYRVRKQSLYEGSLHENNNANPCRGLLKTTALLKHNETKEDLVRMWSAQILLCLIDLHSKGVVCRDLNPSNVLLDELGNIRLTYFSNVDGVDYTLNQDAIKLQYASPEIEGVFEAAPSTDWWSLGALLFEMLVGESLYNCHPNGITCHSVVTLPRRVSNEACSLLSGLLKFSPKARLGAGPTGSEEIKSHLFFTGVDWTKLSSVYHQA